MSIEVEVRQAGLDDTGAISAFFARKFPSGSASTQQGQVEDVPYEALTIYERWLHGGPWMSVETCAILLNHLLLGAGIPLVAVTAKARSSAISKPITASSRSRSGGSLHIAHLHRGRCRQSSARCSKG